ncbi:MAG: hypothetical protein KME21_05475 [Desmonostoc vinosum HA7617-LM4]|jgi:hypothetical protein|nr:hypothetical protein [Desmonostoc vinosum HA7617-LM4]
MALAQNITTHKTQRKNYDYLSNLLQLITLFKKLWWHTKAYTIVFKFMLLTFASLGFLYIHWSGRKLAQASHNNSVLEQE